MEPLAEFLLLIPQKGYAGNSYWVYAVLEKDEVPFNTKEAMRHLA
ncbi:MULTISPECIES: hypothetical protein [Nostocales]|uniref:Transposase n=2 Tax=Nostocales TaxID=1161 RepID=A0ABW8WT90_9CYAN|nr:hypothetical protein [Tolypothrix bouteillei]